MLHRCISIHIPSANTRPYYAVQLEYVRTYVLQAELGYGLGTGQAYYRSRSTGLALQVQSNDLGLKID